MKSFFIAAALLAQILTAAEELQTIPGCQLLPAPWADGDSFHVRTPEGKDLTIRLYGADCVEWHIGDASDARRLRAQRQYFGITGEPKKASESIELAKDFGKQAAEKTAALLAKPFTIHTRFRDALGDGKHRRIYAFVETDEGKDLATELVTSGLARAFGVYADGPVTRTAVEYEKHLDDVELLAAKRGLGIWAKTDWDKLTDERQAQRKDEEETNLAIKKQPLNISFKVDPNLAARDDIMKLPGVGEEIANRIIGKRPYGKPDDLLNVDGIGPGKLKKLLPFLDFPKI